MSVFLSLEHRRMMDASEEALWSAASAGRDPERRIARDVIHDDRIFRVWQPGHLDLLGTAAVARRDHERRAQLLRIATVIEHRRSLIDYVRRAEVRGEARQRLFNLFFHNLDYETAVLKEHRRYVLAVSSGISLESLLGVHGDPTGTHLLSKYRSAHRRYFDLYCQWLRLQNGVYADVVRLAMMEARKDAETLRQRLLELPQASFSGRFRTLRRDSPPRSRRGVLRPVTLR